MNVVKYTYDAWYDSLRKMIFKLLKKVYTDKEKEASIIMPIIAQAPMFTWGMAFTSDSYDSVNNYEVLEFMGDRALKLAFADYILEAHPNLSQGQYSALESEYMSKKSQGSIAEKFIDKDLIRVKNVIMSNKITTDVFESFFGALRLTGDTYIGRGAGILLCVDLVRYLFSNVETIDLKKGTGPTKTQVQQMFSRFKLGIPQEFNMQQEGDTSYKTNIVLTDEQFEFLKTFGINIEYKTIAKNVIGSTKTGSSNRAYERAFEYLTSLGVTSEWAENIKDVLAFEGVDRDLYKKAFEKAEEEGYIRFKIITPAKLAHKLIINMILQGVTKEGVAKNLKSVTFDKAKTSYLEAKEILLKDYIKNQSTRKI